MNSSKQNPSSRISKFYQLSIQDRLKILKERGFIDSDQLREMSSGKGSLRPDEADKMIENVIGVFNMPMGLGLNFKINGNDYIVPMVVEEPSIVAAVSSAAKLVRNFGGFESKSTEPILVGQVQIIDVDHPLKAKNAILQRKNEILNLANDTHPNMVARGGGAKDLEVILHHAASRFGDMVIVHLFVDTRDAMGANLVNSMCENIASLIERISGGRVFLRILSNYATRSLVKTKCTIPTNLLEGKGNSGDKVREGIILANHFAAVDVFRATTHNKGIMNGIDAVAIATGNDWRAIESGAHAYAARGKSYSSLTNWYKDEKGNLIGQIELPLKVGIVGGPLQSNPAVKVVHQLMGIKSAKELAEVMGAVGLAQNFSALRALVTEGIQRGHMSLHARTVTVAAGTPEHLFEDVVDELIESGNIKVWKAQEITTKLQEKDKENKIKKITDQKKKYPSGNGKVILIGEHAVVYGSHAIAAPVPLAIQAKVEATSCGVQVIIPRWGVEEKLRKGADHKYSIYKSLDMLLEKLELQNEDMRITIFPHVPRAMEILLY